jgi:hypothetical protein
MCAEGEDGLVWSFWRDAKKRLMRREKMGILASRHGTRE